MSSCLVAVLADPMCGSGTFLIEAALMAQGKPPGVDRPWWPFYSWPDFDEQAWRTSSEKAESAKQISQSNEVMLLGNDIHEGSLSLALRHAASPHRPFAHFLLDLQ